MAYLKRVFGSDNDDNDAKGGNSDSRQSGVLLAPYD
jgi:hypothetical protein